MEIKSGIEIHQQLDTHKLFCKCPSILRNDEPQFLVFRKLHAVAGEFGDVDIAAKHEVEQGRDFVYQGYDTNCLIELDEEPPNEINEEALKIAVQIALLLNCEIIPITQIMRKTVIDGSNTSGFQRTLMIARNGFVETSKGKVRIESIGLEEDAARIVERESGKVIFRLDRLGIPLVEIGTAPDIKSAEQCKETALLIGDVLRACKVKRGLGTIRQDVNISIPGHPRVEIKGFQDVKMFVPVIENEVKRQLKNIEEENLREEVRNANEDGTTSFLRPMPGASRMYPETDLPLLKISRQFIDECKKNLPKLRSEIKGELKQSGLNEEQVNILLKEDKLEEFKALLEIISEPNLIYKVLIELPKEIASHEKIDNIEEMITIDVIETILHAIIKKQIERHDVKHVFEQIAKGKSIEDALKIEKIDLHEIETEIANIVKEKPGLSIGGYMGLIMNKFKGKISGQQATEILSRLIK